LHRNAAVINVSSSLACVHLERWRVAWVCAEASAAEKGWRLETPMNKGF
jgi:hypothetical protein